MVRLGSVALCFLVVMSNAMERISLEDQPQKLTAGLTIHEEQAAWAAVGPRVFSLLVEDVEVEALGELSEVGIEFDANVAVPFIRKSLRSLTRTFCRSWPLQHVPTDFVEGSLEREFYTAYEEWEESRCTKDWSACIEKCVQDGIQEACREKFIGLVHGIHGYEKSEIEARKFFDEHVKLGSEWVREVYCKMLLSRHPYSNNFADRRGVPQYYTHDQEEGRRFLDHYVAQGDYWALRILWGAKWSGFFGYKKQEMEGLMHGCLWPLNITWDATREKIASLVDGVHRKVA